MSLRIVNRPRVLPDRKIYYTAKRIMDLSLCIMALPLALPLGLIIAVVIYLDSPGPILFVQPRTGKGGQRFKMYKFRSMAPNAEALKAKYAHLNELTYPDFKILHDPRVTRVGRLLRKTSLDELPQIINILKGEMSWVGPRPTSFGVETYELLYTERLEVKPGLTGLWQVEGRSHLDLDERIKLDVKYIENQTLLYDLWILLRTVFAVITHRGAH
jgi:lipopolysaccharide/colanic/teichoic acid biosynthesis glycosyltransferase